MPYQVAILATCRSVEISRRSMHPTLAFGSVGVSGGERRPRVETFPILRFLARFVAAPLALLIRKALLYPLSYGGRYLAVRITGLQSTLHEVDDWRYSNPAEQTVASRGQRLKAFATTSVILVATLGSVADGCDLDVCMCVCRAETDEDEVARENSGHHESDKQRRKTLMRFLVRPVATKEIAYRLALDRVPPSIHMRPVGRREASTVLPLTDSGPPWPDREEDGGILSFRAAQAAKSQSKVPRLGSPEAT